MGWMGGDGWGWGMGGLFMALFWVVVIAAVVLAVRWAGGNKAAPRSSTPLDILKERYARGEIDKKEFDKKKRDLED